MAKIGNLPEFVIFSEFGKSHVALPVSSSSIDHHFGDNDEPMLNIVLVQPVTIDECMNCHFPERQHGKPQPPGVRVSPCKEFSAPTPLPPVNPMDFVRIATDVPHESHAFTEEQLAARKKAGLAAYPGNTVPGGRWRELSSAEAAALLGNANEREHQFRNISITHVPAEHFEALKAASNVINVITGVHPEIFAKEPGVISQLEADANKQQVEEPPHDAA